VKTYLTELTAIERTTRQQKKYAGPNIQAPNWELAQAECDAHYPYLTIVGELVAVIDMEGARHEFNHELN
jgi:hypothetical protein